MEVVAEAKTVIVNMKCDKCGNGFMLRNGHIIHTAEQYQYPHKCNNCGYEENYSITYPCQKVIPIEPFREMTEEEIKNRV